MAVVGLPPDDLARIPVGGDLVVVFDRPTTPGQHWHADSLGGRVRGDGDIVTGHAADIYDPKAVRASTGSLFALPVVRADRGRRGLGCGRTGAPWGGTTRRHR